MTLALLSATRSAGRGLLAEVVARCDRVKAALRDPEGTGAASVAREAAAWDRPTPLIDDVEALIERVGRATPPGWWW